MVMVSNICWSVHGFWSTINIHKQSMNHSSLKKIGLDVTHDIILDTQLLVCKVL